MTDAIRPDSVEEPDDTDDGPSITEPTKIIRIASMTRALLEEARSAGLDDAGRATLMQIHDRSLSELRGVLSDDLLANRIYTDGELSADDLGVELAMALREWGPWGQGFPEPTFDGWFDVLDRRAIGARHCKLRVAPRGTRRALDALIFYQDPEQFEGMSSVRLVYQLEVNEYLGQVTPQLLVRHVL